MKPIKHIGRGRAFAVTVDHSWCGAVKEPGHTIVLAPGQANCQACREKRSAYIETQKDKAGT